MVPAVNFSNRVLYNTGDR